jgi:putative membrane protein
MTTNGLRTAGLAFCLLAHPVLTLAQQQSGTAQPVPWEWRGPWHMWQAGWGFWWVFPLFMFLMMIACVVFMFGHRSGGSHLRRRAWMDGGTASGRWGDPTSSALEILNERFARGEIQQQEYQEKKAAILSP